MNGNVGEAGNNPEILEKSRKTTTSKKIQNLILSTVVACGLNLGISNNSQANEVKSGVETEEVLDEKIDIQSRERLFEFFQNGKINESTSLNFFACDILSKYIDELNKNSHKLFEVTPTDVDLLKNKDDIVFLGFLGNFVLKDFKNFELKQAIINRCILLLNYNNIECRKFINYIDKIKGIKLLEEIPTKLLINLIASESKTCNLLKDYLNIFSLIKNDKIKKLFIYGLSYYTKYRYDNFDKNIQTLIENFDKINGIKGFENLSSKYIEELIRIGDLGKFVDIYLKIDDPKLRNFFYNKCEELIKSFNSRNLSVLFEIIDRIGIEHVKKIPTDIYNNLILRLVIDSDYEIGSSCDNSVHKEDLFFIIDNLYNLGVKEILNYIEKNSFKGNGACVGYIGRETSYVDKNYVHKQVEEIKIKNFENEFNQILKSGDCGGLLKGGDILKSEGELEKYFLFGGNIHIGRFNSLSLWVKEIEKLFNSIGKDNKILDNIKYYVDDWSEFIAGFGPTQIKKHSIGLKKFRNDIGNISRLYLSKNFTKDEIDKFESILVNYVNKKINLLYRFRYTERRSDSKKIRTLFLRDCSKGYNEKLCRFPKLNDKKLDGNVGIEFEKGTPIVYIDHTLYNNSYNENGGGFASNGIIVTNGSKGELFDRGTLQTTLKHELSHIFYEFIVYTTAYTYKQQVQNEIIAYLKDGRDIDEIFGKLSGDLYKGKYKEQNNLSYDQTLLLEKQMYFAIKIVKMLKEKYPDKYLDRITVMPISEWGKLLDYYYYGRETHVIEYINK